MKILVISIIALSLIVLYKASSGKNAGEVFIVSCKKECENNSRTGCGAIDKFYKIILKNACRLEERDKDIIDELAEAVLKLNELCPDTYKRLKR